MAAKKESAIDKKLATKLKAAAETAGSLATPGYEFPLGFKKPKTLGLAADLLWQTRASRLAIQRDVDALQILETAYKQHLIMNLPKADANGVAGKLCRISVSTKEVPQVTNWPDLYKGIIDNYNKHIKKKDGQQDGAFALLNRALGKAAVTEAWNAGEEVQGVGRFTVVDVSINKL
jgi:hypothetical protein